MTENCPRCGKRLNYVGLAVDCRNCGFSDSTAYGRMSQPEVKELVRQVRQRPPLSPKCRGWLHHLCQMKGCGCPHHERFVAAIRRTAAQVEHDNEPGAAEEAEYLRKQADEYERRFAP